MQWNEGKELEALKRKKRHKRKGYERNVENPEYKLDLACLDP